MTNEQLVKLYQQGDKQALEKLLELNKGIVYKVVNKFYIKGSNSMDREDLEQEGCIGLMIAADKYKFNIENQAKFITYAVHWIYHKISRYVNSKSTNEEISLNTHIGEEGDHELIDTIEGVDYGFENVEEKIYIQTLHKELEEVMLDNNSLHEREILKFHYGWDNNKCMTFNEIGELFGYTSERARQIEVRALKKLRNSTWGKSRAIELYIKKKENIYSFNNLINTLDFKSKYLNNEYLDDVIGGIK